MSTNQKEIKKTALTFDPESCRDLAKRAARDNAVNDYVEALRVEDPTLARFIEYALDAPNWSGQPLVGGNVGGDKEDAGFIMNMKKRGWVTSAEEREKGRMKCVFLLFTEAGEDVCREHGIDPEGF